ncbi:MAG TPA: hypothetical protein VGM54_10250 [Chthoniobacter sp.]|jgi:hypothetical protein
MDYFRINMENGFGPLVPPTPAPIAPATMWVDVANWQAFLIVHGCAGTNPPNDEFGMLDFNGTKKFQTKSGIFANGIVNQATYDAAVAAGMTAYPTVVYP